MLTQGHLPISSRAPSRTDRISASSSYRLGQGKSLHRESDILQEFRQQESQRDPPLAKCPGKANSGRVQPGHGDYSERTTPYDSTQRLPVRGCRLLGARYSVVPLPSDTGIPRVRKQQGYATPPSESARSTTPNRPMLDSKAGERALGHRPKADPRPNARPTGMTEPLRLSSIHQTLEGNRHYRSELRAFSKQVRSANSGLRWS